MSHNEDATQQCIVQKNLCDSCKCAINKSFAYSEKKELFYAKVRSYFKDKYDNTDAILLETIKWVGDQDSAMFALAIINNNHGINCIESNHIGNLSKNGRLTIGQHNVSDAFKGVTINSLDNLKDVESVVLYVSINLSQEFFEKTDISSLDLSTLQGNEIINYYANNNFTKNVIYYIPIKTIYTPSSNYIKFFHIPILIHAEILYNFVVQVNYKENSDMYKLTKNNKTPISVNCVTLDHIMRSLAYKTNDKYYK